jgi:hypothetical protein
VWGVTDRGRGERGRGGGGRGREGGFLMLPKFRTHPCFSSLALFLFLPKAGQHTSDAVVDTIHDTALLGALRALADTTVCIDQI